MISRVGGSLNRRIAAVAGALFLVALGLITFFVTRILHEDMQKVLSKQQLTTVTYIARDIEAKVRLRLDSLQRVAGNVPPALLAHPAELQVWLEDRRAIHTLFPTGLMIIPADGGAPLADTPRLKTRPRTFTDREWFMRALQTRQPVLSKPLVTRATNEPALVIAVPLLDHEHKVLAVLAGVTPLTTPGFLDLIVGSRPGRQGSYQLISAEDRRFVLTSEGGQALESLPPAGHDVVLDRAAAGQFGSEVSPAPDGIEELASIAPVPLSGWTLIERQPVDEVFAPVRNTIQNTLLITLALALPFLAVLLAALHRLLQPFADLAVQLHAMADGTRPMAPVATHAADEVADVAASFNRLQHKLLEQEKRLAEMAHHDALTGLPNRRTVQERLEAELLRVRRKGSGLALLFLDLDGFKPVNDTHGHPVGDQVLVQIAQRLLACVRDVDTVARLGGDEFLILLCDTASPKEAAERVAQQCLEALALPFRIGELRLQLGVSIGIALAEGEVALGLSAAQLMSHADLAMYQAKAAGRGRYVLHVPATDLSAPESHVE